MIMNIQEELKELFMRNKHEIAKDIENEVFNLIHNKSKNKKRGTRHTYTQDDVEDNFGIGCYISQVLHRMYNGNDACHDTEVIREIESIIIKNPRFVTYKEKVTDIEGYFKDMYMWEPNKNEREVLDNDSRYDDKFSLLVEICASGSGIELFGFEGYALWSHVTIYRIEEEISILVKKWDELIEACRIEEERKDKEYNIDPILDSMIDQCIYILNMVK